jgi:hypothetical protein
MPSIVEARFAACTHNGVADGEPHAVLLCQQAVAGAIAPIHEEVRFFYISQLSGEHDRFPCISSKARNLRLHLGLPRSPIAEMPQGMRVFK